MILQFKKLINTHHQKLHELKCLASLKNFPKDSDFIKICVVKLDHIGDLLLATPVFRGLKESYPDSHITAVVSPESASLLSQNPFVDEVIQYSAPWFWRNLPHGEILMAKLAYNSDALKDLLAKKYDLVVNLRADLANLLFSSSIPHSELLGFVNHTIYPYLVSKPVDCPIVLHACEQHKYLLREGLGINVLSQPELFLSVEDRAKAERILPKDKPIVALAPAAGIPLKEWPIEKYSELAQRLVAHGMHIIVVGAPSDNDLAAMISRSATIQNLCGGLTLLELAAVLSRCHVLVSNDSAPAHIGAAAGTTVVCLMRPNVVDEFRPVGEQHIIFSATECSSVCNGFDGNNRNSLLKKCKCIEEICLDQVEEATLNAVAKRSIRHNEPPHFADQAQIVSRCESLRTLIVRGDLRSHSGYAFATRCYTRSWRSAYDVVFGVDISYHQSRHADVWPFPLIEDSEISAICEKNPNTTVATISSPDNFRYFAGAHNIGLFFYETDRFERIEWREKILLMDEVRVPAPFLSNMLRPINGLLKLKIEPVPLTENREIEVKMSSDVPFVSLQSFADNGQSNERELFSRLKSKYSHIFFSSCTAIPRKGLPILAHEWLDFVSKNQNCALLLKLSSIDVTHSKEDVIKQVWITFQRIQRIFPSCLWNVYCTSDSLSDEDILSIQSEVDGFITCSFGEGFGLGLFESLSIGTSVICPRHTTFSDYLPRDYPYFLETHIANYGIADPANVYPISARWGVPVAGSLSPLLKTLIIDLKSGIAERHISNARKFFLQAIKLDENLNSDSELTKKYIPNSPNDSR
jgi:ADP-heptose:LPS heptosyltransferase